MTMKLFAVGICTLSFIGIIGQVSCFGGNTAALTSGAFGATGGFGGTGGAFGATGGLGGSSGLGGLGAIAALGGEGAGGLLRLQLLSQPGFIQQLSQCRLINTIFQG